MIDNKVATALWSYFHQEGESITLPLQYGFTLGHVLTKKTCGESNNVLALSLGILKALAHPQSFKRPQYEPSLASLVDDTRPCKSDSRFSYSAEAIINLAASTDTPVGYSYINEASQGELS